MADLTVVGSGKTGRSEPRPSEGRLVVGTAGGALEHGDVRENVLALRRKTEESYWELSIALHEVYTSSYYVAWGFESWKDYVETELDFRTRKAQYLVGIQEWFGKMKPNVQQWVRELGWTKAKELTGVVTNDNASQWRRDIEGKSYREMMVLVDRHKQEKRLEAQSGPPASATFEPTAPGEDEREIFTKRSYQLAPAQVENVDLAFQKAKELAESDKEGNVLDLICSDFLQGHVGTPNVKDAIAQLERQVGLKLIAWDPNQDVIVYGSNTLTQLAAEDAEGAELPE